MKKDEPSVEKEKSPNEKDTSLINEVLVGDEGQKGIKDKASTLQTLFNTIKLFIGISILASPHAVSNSGIVGGIVGFTVSTGLAITTVLMQSEASEQVEKEINSYSDLGYALYKGRGKLVVDSFILFAQLGIGISYLIFNGKQIDQIVCLESQGEIGNNQKLYIGMAVVVLTPLGWIKHLKNLSWIAFIALAGMIMTISVILYYDIKYISEDPEVGSDV